MNLIRQWLEKLGLDESHLECGVHDSVHRETRNEMIRQGIKSTALNNNCSGKHTGFITVAAHDNVPIRGYVERKHPVQQRVLQTLEELTDEYLHDKPAGLDGCGIPVTGISLYGMALAFARMAASEFDSKTRRTARSTYSFGHGKISRTRWWRKTAFVLPYPKLTENRILIKVGAEGVYAGMTSTHDGLGMAIKIDDGSRRAAEIAMGWLITTYCKLEQAQLEQLKPWIQPEVRTVAKNHAGIIRPVLQ